MFTSGFLADRMNRPKVLAATQSACPDPPPLTGPEMLTKIDDTLDSMGVQACMSDKYTDNSVREAEGGVGLGPMRVAGGSSETTMNITDNTTIGCETIAVAMKETNNLKNAIACSINKSGNVTNVNMSAGNTITILAQGSDKFGNRAEVHIDCTNAEGGGTFNITQKINIKSVTMSNMSSQTRTEMATAAQDAIKNTAEAIQRSETGKGAVAEGGKSVDQQLTNILSQDYKAKIDEEINKVSVQTDAQNNLKIIAKDGALLKIKGKGCEINQDIVIDMIAQNMANSIMTDSFSSVFETMVENKSKSDQTAIAKGVESGGGWMDLVKMIVGGMVLVGIVAMVFKYIKEDKNKKNSAVPGVSSSARQPISSGGRRPPSSRGRRPPSSRGRRPPFRGRPRR